jgi:hypothetical protein
MAPLPLGVDMAHIGSDSIVDIYFSSCKDKIPLD